jgi:kinesin family protein 26
MQSNSDHTIYAQIAAASGSTMIVAGALKHANANKSSNFPTPKNSPLRKNPSSSTNQEGSPSRKIEEKWIDGPRVSKYRVAEARHLMREINHVKKCETWIDGPNMSPQSQAGPSVQTIANVTTHGGAVVGYGYMDSHKKKMIRQWVENQTCQILQQINTTTTTPVQYHSYYKSQSHQRLDSMQVSRNEDDRCSVASSKHDEFVNPLNGGLSSLPTGNANCAESSIKTGLKQQVEHEHEIRSEKSASNISENRPMGVQSVCGDFEEEDQDSGPSEVPPALPLIDPLCSREVSRHVSRESLAHNVIMMDCALQVTEDDIAKAMGG